jgi:Fur family transcriptional regulator, ferric uptake regulator
MSHHTWNYQEALRKAGFRVTPQRELVLDLICTGPARPTARQLCDAARRRSPAVNPATVYRTLRFLAEQRLIRTIERDGTTCYELAGPHAAHHHLVCDGCGCELEVPETATASFYADLERTYGFEVESDHLELRGRCAACRGTPR